MKLLKHLERPEQVTRPSPQLWRLALLLLVLATVMAVRIRLLELPLERDEGEYAYAGQLMLQGVPPYQEVYSMKWPGTFAAYALIMAVFGQTIGGIHTGLILVNLATALLVYRLASRVAGPTAAVVAAGTYALLSIEPRSLGLAAHATHFVVLPAVAGLVLLARPAPALSVGKIFGAGVLLGLAALMKQSGIAFGLFAVAWLLHRERQQLTANSRRLLTQLGSLAAGGLLPLLLTGIALAYAGVFGRFWLWTVRYAQEYAAILTPVDGLRILIKVLGDLVGGAPGLWILAATGLVVLFVDRVLQPQRFFIGGFFLFSVLALCTGWYFRQHYFLLLLPALGILAGIAVESFARWLGQRKPGAAGKVVPLAVFAVAGMWFIFSSRLIFFALPPDQVSHALYGSNPFPECVEFGRFLQSRCPPTGRIAVFGSEPELFFYAHRRSATGYIYTYPLMEPQPFAKKMQQEMMQEITAANPDYLVFVGIPASWLPQPDSDFSIVRWFTQYQQEHFQLMAMVETMPGYQLSHTNLPPEQLVAPATNRWLAIYKNKSK